MKLGFVLFNWQPQGGLQQDLVKVVRACQGRADIEIHCLGWQGEKLPGVATIVADIRRLSKTGTRQAFADYVVQQVKSRVDLLVGFNRLPGLDYYFAADSCFAQRAQPRSWLYRLAPRTRQYLRFEAAVFGPHSHTVALLLSELQRQQYQQHYQTPADRLIDLPAGIYRHHCAGPDAPALRADFRQRLGIGDDALVVLQVGSSFHTKGVDRSLGALAALPPALHKRVHYCLLGHDKHSKRWQAQAWQITGLGERLHFLPANSEVRHCMQGADLLLHPSRHESAGMVILEAVVAGLPVLTTASCGYAAHVVAATAGLVCPLPFEQETLNTMFSNMLQSGAAHWRSNGIEYGRSHNLYDMPAAVADILLNRRAG